jgi:chromosome segregation ATPase
VGLFDEMSETPPKRNGRRIDGDKDTSLLDWLERRAEADLGLARAFAAGETQRVDQIKHLEATLVGQIAALQNEILESRKAELSDLKSEISACAHRLASIDVAAAARDATREFVQDKLGVLRAQHSERQIDLETRHTGFERLGESLGGRLRTLEEHIEKELNGVDAVQAELRHWKSEAKSLAERVGQAESTAWQSQSLAARNGEQLQQTAESLQGEVAALKALFDQLNEQQRSLRRPDTLLNEISHTLGAKIEEILDQLAREHNARTERDLRLGHLESGLGTLAERLSKTESLSRETRALAQTETDSAADFRTRVANELAALHIKIGNAQQRLPAIENLENTWRAKFAEWQQWSAQKFMLLENRHTEQEKIAREFSDRLVEQDRHNGETLRALESVHGRLLHVEPKIQSLTEQIGQAESLAQAVQSHAHVGAARVSQLEDNFKNTITGLRADIAEINEHQRASRLPGEQIAEIEHKLSVAIDDIHRRLTVEREGFDHWGKGLRESFGSELGAIQARLSERQSEIEYRYSNLQEHLGETVKASIVTLEAKLNERSQSQNNAREDWANLRSALEALDERASQLESKGRQIEDSVTTTGRDVEKRIVDLTGEISAVKTSLDQRTAMLSESLNGGLERAVRAALCDLEDRVNEKFSIYDSRHSRCVEQTEQDVNALRSTLEPFNTMLAKQQSDLAATASSINKFETALGEKLVELDQKFTDRLAIVDSRDAEGARRAQETLAALQSGITALQGELSELKAAGHPRLENPPQPDTHVLEEAFASKFQDFQQQVAQRFELFDQRHTERSQQTERVTTEIRGELSELKAVGIARPQPLAQNDIHALEDSFASKLQDFHQQLAQRLELIDQRHTERSQQTERVTTEIRDEMSALKADLSRPAVIAADDSALRVLEQNLNDKIHEVEQQVAQNAGLFESRDAELKELNERSQSLIQRVAQLSSAIQVAQNTGPVTVQPIPARPTGAVEEPTPPSNGSENLTNSQTASEKEQLVKLQERMSAEIERVRAELKERSGRWKVRRSAS